MWRRENTGWTMKVGYNKKTNYVKNYTDYDPGLKIVQKAQSKVLLQTWPWSTAVAVQITISPSFGTDCLVFWRNYVSPTKMAWFMRDHCGGPLQQEWKNRATMVVSPYVFVKNRLRGVQTGYGKNPAYIERVYLVPNFSANTKNSNISEYGNKHPPLYDFSIRQLQTGNNNADYNTFKVRKYAHKWLAKSRAGKTTKKRQRYSNDVGNLYAGPRLRPRIINPDLARAVGSPYKYFVSAHGSVSKNMYEVPRGVVVVFMTCAGGLTYRPSVSAMLTSNESVRNVLLQQQGTHSVVYFGGDVIHDYSLSFPVEDYGRGVHKLPLTTNTQWPWKKTEKPVDSVGYISKVARSGNLRQTKHGPSYKTYLSQVITELLKFPVRSTTAMPVVVFVGCCRGAYNKDTFKACKLKNEQACARVGHTPANVKYDTARNWSKDLYEKQFKLLNKLGVI